MENESVTLTTVSRQRERWDGGSRIGDGGSRIGDAGSRIGETGSRLKGSGSRIKGSGSSRIEKTGSSGGLAVSLTPVGFETWILFLAFFIVVIR